MSVWLFPMEKALGCCYANCVASSSSNLAIQQGKDGICYKNTCLSDSLCMGGRRFQRKCATGHTVFVLPMKKVSLIGRGSRQSVSPVRCLFVCNAVNEHALVLGSYDSGCVLGPQPRGTKTRNWSSHDQPASCFYEHCCSKFASEDDFSLKDSYGQWPSRLERVFSYAEETNLHFLEETDEKILSGRILTLSRTNKMRSALELFSSMELAGLTPDPHACNSLISCILRNDSLGDALRVFETMRKKEVGTGHSYSLILKAVASAQGSDHALKLFLDLEKEGSSKKNFDIIVYNTMISVFGKERNWFEAEKMWRKLKENCLHGTVLTYSLLVSTFVQCGQNEFALAAYSEMIENGREPTEDVMKAIISSCTKEGQWAVALNVLERMLQSGIKPSIIIFNAVINCLGKAGEINRAFRVYDLLRTHGHSPDTYTWNALLSALYRCKRYSDCVRLFENINKSKGLENNIHLYNTTLMSCQRLGLWDRSLQFLWQMEASGMQMSTATYNLVIGACEKARKPKVALQVYHHMVHKDCRPDTFTYLSLIKACVWGSLWTDVEYILEHVEPDASLYNALIHGFCLRGKTATAKKLYEKMHSSGLKPDGKTRAFMLQNIAGDSCRRHPRYVIRNGKGRKHT